MRLALLLLGSQLPSPLRPAQRAVPGTLDRTTAGGRASHPVPSPRGPKILAPDPAAVTLQTGDLPSGYHVLKANKASFSSGESDAYPSWDDHRLFNVARLINAAEMAKKALIIKAAAKPKFAVRAYTRCQRCGRPKSVYRKFGLCRVCIREMAHRGELPGVSKASW